MVDHKFRSQLFMSYLMDHVDDESPLGHFAKVAKDDMAFKSNCNSQLEMMNYLKLRCADEKDLNTAKVAWTTFLAEVMQ